MARADLLGRSTGSGFDLTSSSEHLSRVSSDLLHSLPFNELNLVGLAIDLQCPDTVGWVG